MNARERRELDRWILRGPPEPPEPDEDEDGRTRCSSPGPRGCGYCDSCIEWGDAEYHRRKDEGEIVPRRRK